MSASHGQDLKPGSSEPGFFLQPAAPVACDRLRRPDPSRPSLSIVITIACVAVLSKNAPSQGLRIEGVRLCGATIAELVTSASQFMVLAPGDSMPPQRQIADAMTPQRVTLTFDNGPTPGTTEGVLEILDREKIRSTFFVIGRNLADPAAAALARKAHSAGHWIGNHTFSHSVALGDRPDPDHAAREIGDSQRAIGDLSHPNKLFRPYGNSGRIGAHLLSQAAIAYLLANRFQTVLWNNVPGDWKDASGWVERCLDEVLKNQWSVVVLHDIEEGCLPRLSELILRLNDLNVTFEQDYPESVVLTRAGKIINISSTYVSG